MFIVHRINFKMLKIIFPKRSDYKEQPDAQAIEPILDF